MSYLTSATAFFTATDIDKQFRTTQTTWDAMANSLTPTFRFLNSAGVTTNSMLQVGDIVADSFTGDLNGPLGGTTPSTANITEFNSASANPKTFVNTSTITNLGLTAYAPNLADGGSTQFIIGVVNNASNAGSLSFVNVSAGHADNRLEVGLAGFAATQFKQAEVLFPKAITVTEGSTLADLTATSASAKNLNNTNTANHVALNLIAPLANGAYTQVIVGKGNSEDNAGFISYNHVADNDDTNFLEIGLAGNVGTKFGKTALVLPQDLTVPGTSTLNNFVAQSTTEQQIINTTTTANTALTIYSPLDDSAYTQVIIGKVNSTDNAGFLSYNHVADDDDTNTVELGLSGNVGTKFGKDTVTIPNHLNVPVGNITQTTGTTQLNHLNSTNGMVGSLIESAALDVGETRSAGTIASGGGASTNFLEVGTPIQVSSQDADNGIMELEVEPGIYMVSASANIHLGATQNYLLSLGQGTAGLTSASNVVVGPSILVTAQWASGTSYTLVHYPPTIIYASVTLYIKLMLAQTAAARDDLVDPYMCVVRIA